VVRAFEGKLAFSAEPVEKVQMANLGNFDIVKNQQLTGRRIEQKRQFLGFSTGSLSISGSKNFKGVRIIFSYLQSI